MPVKIKNESEYQKILANILAKRNGTAIEESETAKPKKPRAKKKNGDDDLVVPETIVEPGSASPQKKRQGVKEAPILTSLRTCSTKVEASKTHVSMVFDGARLFTLNELFALLQYRSYIVFAYKKEWQRLVGSALKKLGKDKPHFDGPCKITLFRQGKKPVDRDSLMVMFKYIIDALKDEPKKGHEGIFPDDNPDIVFEDEKLQAVGEPVVGIRIDLIVPRPSIPNENASWLFDATRNSSTPELASTPLLRKTKKIRAAT